MFYLPTRRTHYKPMPKYRKSNKSNLQTHTHKIPTSPTQQPPIIYPKQKDKPMQTLTVKPNHQQKIPSNYLNPRKEETKDPKTNKTATERALSTAKPNIIKIIEPIQNTTLRLVTGSYRTSPTAGILFEAKEMPLEQRRKLHSLRYAIKIASTPNNPAYNNTFADRLTNQHNRNSKLPAAFYIRLKGYPNAREITSTPIIERNHGKIAP